MKFTTLIPIIWNDGSPVDPDLLKRVIDGVWRPYGAMTEHTFVSGHWTDDDGVEFSDKCIEIAIDCDRGRLQEAIKSVRRAGRKLKQRAMYFEVSGYDGVQILRID